MFMNKDTGEILTYKAMRRQWAEEYDGDDPTNALDWKEQYESIHSCIEGDYGPSKPWKAPGMCVRDFIR